MTTLSPEFRLPPNSVHIGIYDEADPLKIVATWGAVGAEAVLTQCYPEEISLFHQSFDTLAARQEGLNYAATLQDHGVKVLMMRDLLTGALTPTSLRRSDIISAMIQKATSIQSQYGTQVKGYSEAIATLVEQDIDRYGEDQALQLNKTLSLDPELPLGNSLYGRDHMNVLLNTRVISHMAKPIRHPEVKLFELVYKRHLIPHETIYPPFGETFEGGDAYIHNGTVFVGVGTRTTLGAAVAIYQTLKPQLEEADLKFAIVEDGNHRTRSFREQQDSMHLDTFSNPIGKTAIAVCVEEARKRRLRFLATFGGKLVVNDYPGSFMDYLERTEDGIVVIPREEQKGFGANFLLKGEDSNGTYTVFVPLRDNTDTNNQLLRSSTEVVYVDLDKSTKGWGGAHCMTGQLLRKA